MCVNIESNARDKTHDIVALLSRPRAIRHEGAVRIHRIFVPTVDGFIAPWAHTGCHDDVESIKVVLSLSLKEEESSMYAGSLITMHTTSDEYSRFGSIRCLGLDGVERVAFWIITQSTILNLRMEVEV